MPTATTRMRTTKDEQCKPVPKRPTPLQYFAGILALALACFSLLYCYFYNTPAHASFSQTITGQVPFDDTETDTPSQTVTNTPSSTVTKTSTPIPSPSVTRTSTPLPTSTSTATSTARTSTTATGKQTPLPVQTSLSNAGPVTGGNETPNATTNNQGNQSNQGGIQSGNTFPFLSLIVFLGSIVLLGLLGIAWWMILRGRGLSRRSRKLSRSGAASWSRTRITDQHNSIVAQRAFDLATPQGGGLTSNQEDQAGQRGTMSQAVPSSSRSDVTNNASVTLYAAKTIANLPSYSSPGVPRPGGFITPGGNPPVSFNAMANIAPEYQSTNDPVSFAETPEPLTSIETAPSTEM
jgi:hypothetical protein